MKAKELQKGVALYIALIMMSFLLAAGLGLTVIIVGQLKTMKGIGDSVVAFQAADTGIEEVLYNRRKLEQQAGTSPTCIGNACTCPSISNPCYQVSYFYTAEYESWQSVGIYSKQRRAIKIDQKALFDFTFKSDESSFCIVGSGDTTTTQLHAILVPPSSSQHVTFSAENLPTGVSAIFNPLDGDLLDVDPVDFYFNVSGASTGTYSINIKASTLKKTHQLTFSLEIKSSGFCPP